MNRSRALIIKGKKLYFTDLLVVKVAQVKGQICLSDNCDVYSMIRRYEKAAIVIFSFAKRTDLVSVLEMYIVN